MLKDRKKYCQLAKSGDYSILLEPRCCHRFLESSIRGHEFVALWKLSLEGLCRFERSAKGTTLLVLKLDTRCPLDCSSKSNALPACRCLKLLSRSRILTNRTLHSGSREVLPQQHGQYINVHVRKSFCIHNV